MREGEGMNAGQGTKVSFAESAMIESCFENFLLKEGRAMYSAQRGSRSCTAIQGWKVNQQEGEVSSASRDESYPWELHP